MRKGDRVKYSYKLYSNVSGRYYKRWHQGQIVKECRDGVSFMVQVNGNKNPTKVDRDRLHVVKAFDPAAANQISMFLK